MVIDKLKKSAIKSFKSLYKILLLILGVLLLVSLIPVLIPKSFYVSFFQKNPILDSVIGSIIGSISAGSPITNYILGGEFLKDGGESNCRDRIYCCMSYSRHYTIASRVSYFG
jgi:hypothetical protein